MAHDQYFRNIVALFILCTITIPLVTGEVTTEPQEAPEQKAVPLQPTPAQLAELENVLKGTHDISTYIKNIISRTIVNIKKYGKNIDNKDVIVKKLLAASEELAGFIQRKSRPIEHYAQQSLNTIPLDAYQEIYSLHFLILQNISRFLDAFNSYIQGNFKEEFDYSFLLTKDSAILDEQIAVATVLKQHASLIKQIEASLNTSNTIGLTLWNKTARTINKYVVQPCDRYHIPEIAGIGSALTASAIFLYWISYGDRLQTTDEKSAEETQSEQKDSLRKGKPQRLSPNKPKDVETEKGLLKKFIDWLCGPIPASKNGIWFVNDEVIRSSEDYTLWNKCACVVHNLLSPDPLAAVIHTFYAYLFNKYIFERIWPVTKYSVQNWWRHSLGGAEADMQPMGTWVTPAHITFDHVIGLDHIKNQLMPAVEYAANPAKYANFGDKIPTNYIFYGLKRTGKSFFADALAGEMQARNSGITFLKVPCAAFREFGVQTVIDIIRSYAPCIAFIDEADIAGFNRGMDRNTTGDLLKALGEGNISPSPERPVFLVFATNKKESFDTSLTSFGRFGASIHFTTPSFYDRIQFIVAILNAIGRNPNNFDVQHIAEKTDGESFENIKYCIIGAMLKADIDNKELSTELIIEGINEILHGLYPEYPIELHAETIEVLAAHFAGKALVTVLTESNETLDTVSICKRVLPLMEDYEAGFTGKPTRQPKYEYGLYLTRKQQVTEQVMGPKTAKSYVMRMVAGAIAEEILLGKTTNQCQSVSMMIAIDTLLTECSDGGFVFSYKDWIGETQKSDYWKQALTLLDDYKQEVRALLTEHRKALDVTARALQMLGTITDGLVMAIKANPDEINVRLDELEQQRKNQYEQFMAEQQKAVEAQQQAA